MPLPQLRSTEDEAIHREMERVSLDWCMIYNPTDEDFYIDWLPWHHLVPNKNKDLGWGAGMLETQRYLARWYCEHMTVNILNKRGKEEGEKMLAKRSEEGKVPLTQYEEQQAVWAKVPKTNDEKELMALYPILFLGVSREFGMDMTQEKPYEVDQKTTQEQVMEKLQTKKYTPKPVPTKESMQAKRNTPTNASTQMPSVEDIEALMPKREGVKNG